MQSPRPRRGARGRWKAPSRDSNSCRIAPSAGFWRSSLRRWSEGMPEKGAIIFAAGLLVPVSAPPIRDGAIVVKDGRIAAVGTLDDAGRDNPDADVRYFPRDTIIPGAINAHAHLGFRRHDPPEGGTFSGWLERLIERLPEKETWTAEAARNSAREAIEAGTTFMAESSPYGQCLPQLAESGLAGTVYAEFFPHELGTPEEAVEFIVNKVRKLREGLPERVDAQVSVHSPYTVDPESSRLAAPQTVAAHLATGVSEEDIEIPAYTGVAAAHCPRSNEFLGCGVSPVPQMMERGVRVGMGTDGLWSSPSMNLFEETLFAVKLHGMNGATGLRLATLEGARALGIEAETGSLEVGKWADLALVEAPPDAEDPGREVLEVAANGGVAATVV